MKYQIKRSISKQFFFVLKSNTGETITTSEMYESKQSCKKGIRAVKTSLFANVIDLTL